MDNGGKQPEFLSQSLCRCIKLGALAVGGVRPAPSIELKIESNRTLEAMGQCLGSYGNLLMHTVLEKMPGEI